MPADVFFDTNILLYAAAPDSRRGEMALALVHEGGAFSVQVLNEFVTVARRKMRWSLQDIRDTLADFRSLCRAPLPLLLSSHEQAFGIAAQTGYSFFDSLIIATALEARCTTLLSEDMQHERVIEGRLTIRNPFLA